MLKKIGDGILTLFVIIIIIVSIFGDEEGSEYQFDDAMPPAIESSEIPQRGFGDSSDDDQDSGRVLPAPGRFDDQSRVEAGRAKNWSSGTGFAIAAGGLWLTAKHVANGCDRLGILNENGRVGVKARPVYIAENADVAVFQTQGGPPPLALDLDESDIKIGAKGFHVGYPQGKPGEVTSRLIGRELMVTEGAWQGKEQTLAWAETGRTNGLNGSLGGLSGGPAFDIKGNVVGITIAESPRRGRVITTSAASITSVLEAARIEPSGNPEGNLGARDFSASAQRLRADLKVVQVICLTGS
jgi:serine protease Do